MNNLSTNYVFDTDRQAQRCTNEGHEWESTNEGQGSMNKRRVGMSAGWAHMNGEHKWGQGQMRAGTACTRVGGAQVQGFIISI